MAIMEINNLPLVSSVNDTDLLVIETSKGTRAVTKSTLSPSTMIFSNVAPTDTNTCWVDISKGNMIKVYNPVTSTWENISNLSSPVIYYMADGVVIVKGLIYKYKDASDIVIPSEIDGMAVTGIGVNSFSEYTNLTSITIPSTVTSIDKNAFNGCTALTTVYYTGSEEEWNAISISNTAQNGGNTPLFNATKVFNYGTPIQKLPVVNSNDTGKSLQVSETGEWIVEKNNIPTNLINGNAAGSLRGISALAEDDTYTMGENAFAVGENPKASGLNAFASGYLTVAEGTDSHAEGAGSEALGSSSHAEGNGTKASGSMSHAEGWNTRAIGAATHVEGTTTAALGIYSHSEGSGSTALGSSSHAEGSGTIANSPSSHSEGAGATYTRKITGDLNTKSYTINDATGIFKGAIIRRMVLSQSNVLCGRVTKIEDNIITLDKTLSYPNETEGLTEVNITVHVGGLALGTASHVEGTGTIASNKSQHVNGEYNIIDENYNLNPTQKGKYVNIIGNGTSNTARSNAHTLDWNGNAWFAGDVYINSTSGINKDEGSKKLATEEYINNSISNLEENLLNTNIPEYWNEELLNKSDIIQQAMEKAGRNKSAFLWYTDAHWQNNAKVSPKLLSYLIENTPINKINFGGDIINDPSEHNHNNIKYAYEWRKMISNLSNHHSVYGNHDVNHRTTDVNNMAYAYMLAPEESNDMVVGGESYYYIDSPSEKTRYLYLSYMTNNHTEMLTQGQFIVDAIKSVQEGWHIVVIAHRWWQYTSSSSPTVGAVPAYEAEILSILDAYNTREARNGSNYFYAQDFKDAKGKVEFCIGGHIHADYDFTTDGGIPIIITASDTNQERSGSEDEDCGTMGTITESAVYGIIADYSDSTDTKITVVGIGRGTSRVVKISNIKPSSISNITYSGDTTVGATIDKTKFNFTVNYSNGTTNTIVGASSVSPATINVIGNNTVTITYTEGTVTLAGTVIIVGTPVPVVNLFNANRTFVAGTADTQIENYLDETKAYTNVAYGNGKFNASACTVSNVTEDSLTVKESGIGGVTVAYAFYLPDCRTNDYRITFDYSGTGKCRTYYRYAVNGVVGGCESLFLNDTAGASGSADFIIPANTDNYTWLIIMFSSNTGGTKTFENITLTKVNNNSSTNLIDTVGYNDNMRLSTSDGVTLKEATGYTTTGLIDISNYTGTVKVYTYGANFNKQVYEHAFMYTYNADGTFNTAYATGTGSSNNVIYEADADGNLTLTFDMANCADWMKRFRLTGYGNGLNLIITVNKEIV